MNHIKYVKIDTDDHRIYDFRKRIILENNGDLKYLTEDIKYDPSIDEEVWKFSKRKWESLGFDSLYAAIIDNVVYAISGARTYGNYVRFGMMYYRIKNAPTELRSPLWVENGFLQMTINDLVTDTTKSYFMTIYPHNNKLQNWVTALSQGRYRQGNTTMMKELKVHDPIIFNDCNQYIVYKSLEQFDIQELINELQN